MTPQKLEPLGIYIRRRLEELNKSQAQLARDISASTQVVGTWVTRNFAKPTLKYILPLAKALDVPVEEILKRR